MRVCFISHYSQLYGANRSMLNLIDGLKSYPINIFVVLPVKGEIEKELQDRKIPYKILPFDWYMSKRYYSGRFYHRILQHVKYLWEAAKRRRNNRRSLPAISTQILEWKIDVLFSNSSVINIGQHISDSLKIPHIWCWREKAEEHYGYRSDNFKWRTKNLISRSSLIISVSANLKEYIKVFSDTEKVKVIYNGVYFLKDCEELINKRRRLNDNRVSKEEFVFGIIGLLHPQKGIEDAIKAISVLAKEHENISLLIAGNGNDTYTEKLKHMVEQNGLQSTVNFIGFITDPSDFYNSIDVLLMCSRNEGMGRVTVEAMANGIPVIGFRSGATGELITEGENGYLYTNIEELLVKMKLMIVNRKELLKLGVKGNQWVVDNCTIELCSNRIYSSFKELSNSRVEN